MCETDAGGNPTSTCTDLIPPGAFAAGTVSFTAPAHTTLARGATYSVVMASAGIFSVSRTLSNAQDMGHAPDWSIADNFEALGLSNAWAADSNGNALRIAIKGAAGGATPSTDAELSGLSLGTGVTLTPTFASGTYAYAASVANAVDEVTVTPATNHASATIQYLNASDRALADVDAAAGHQVALAEGENLIKVKVTAQDATTTQTYAVTVTRAAAPATCTLETGDIWCGVLTVGSNSAGSRNGYHSGQYGQLSDTAFDLSSTEYTVESVRWVTEDEEGKDLILDLDALPAESVWSDRWYLQVDANKYYTANAVDMADQLRFRNAYESRPSPALNTTVTVRLTTSSAGALGHNALLTALTVNDGTDDLTLSPAFDNGTFDYTTSVAFGVETVTFTPTTFDRELVSYWTVATKLVDADAMADGFQVTLDVGANKIRVWALSEDGGDNTGYYVTVTRAGAVDTPTSFAAEAGDAQVTLSWEAPASALGVLRHEYRFVTFQIGFFYNEGVHLFGPWTPILDSGVGGANEDGFTVTGLTNNTVHIFQLRAAVTDGESVPATSEEVTPVVPDDFPDDTTTSGVVEVGGSATGHIEVKEDRDWFKVVLEADKTYQIDMEGAETGKGDLIDPSLTRILDEAGTLVVVFDSGVDDGGQGLNSRATFTPSVAGTYHVEAARFFSNTGTYTLTVREAMPTDATLSALMVNDGSSDLTLTPAFASGTYAYAVSVANAVDEITVTPTTNQAAATFAWLDADDNALADADTTTGHQVALAVGANVFKVKVTGGDGTSTLTYTVTVTRAAAPTTCTLATGDIWCGVLTVGSNSAGSRNGYHSGQYGQLSDTKFDLSSTEYTVESIRWVTATGQSKDLILDLDGLPAEDVWRTWRLQVDANKFSTTNVDPLGTDDQLRFENAYEARPAPALNTAVTVRLTTSSTGELGYDGALSALTVKDGNADLTLSPAFDRDTYDYTTSVASDVETVTFTATAIDRGSVVYRVGNTTLVDADAMAAGFQVTLEVGANAIDVDAFSEDGGFREIYTVTVTRAGAVDTPTSFTTEAAGFQVTLSWVAPASGSGVTGHEYRFVTFTIGSIYIEGVDLFGPWTQIPDSGVGGANEDGYTVTGLTNDVVHIFQVRAASASGYSAPATSAEVTPTVVDDFPADTTTSGVVAVGGSATGVIGSALDLDWFQVMLAAGKTYQIDMEGSETGRGDLDDPYLSAIHDGVGALVLDLTLDPGIDDGGQGLNSRATFTPSAAGAYYVAVAGRGSSTGGYTLFVREVMPADATLSALMVNDGSSDLTLTPAFASGTYAYTVSVANAVDEVTVTPTTNQAAATFAWLDADDNALADADTTTGHQVALAVGANVIKAKVTAADGDTTQTYTVTVTRAGGLPSLSIADAAATEGDDLSFTATLSAAAAAEVTATWTASIGTGDTAVAADLGTTKTGTVTVSMGTTTGTFTVSTTEDSLDEDDETFTVTLSNVSSNAQLAADPTAKGTINDDDGTTTTCTLNTGDVWCGTVTVGTETSTGGTTTGHGFSSGGSVGTLTDNSGNQTFTYGTQTYVVSRVVVGVGSFAGELAFRVQRSSPENFVLDDDHRAKLALHVAGSTTPFAFRDTTGYNATLGYVWSNSGLDWSSATTVTVRLRELPDAPTGFEAAVGNAQVGLTWDAPASGANITRHEFRYKTGGGSYPTTWTPIATSAPGGTNEAGYTVTGLTNEIAHTFELRAVNDSGAGAAVESDEVTPTPGICGRTEIVQEFLIYYLEDSYSVVRACAEVNVADLAQFTGFDGANGGIGSLKSGDFAGLTNVTHVFLSRNDFTTLPVDLFSDMTALRHLTVDFGKLTSLPDGVFSDLTLNTLKLGDNDLTSLPAGLFSGLSSLVEIQLHGNDLEALPDGLFSGLSSLVNLQLQSNNLEQLPAGLFSGLTGLTVLDLRDNPDTDDVLPLTVTVEKVGTDEARAKVLAGAPFAVNFTPTVVNGSLAASDTKLGVAAGSVEGTAETVTRTSGTTEPVTVDIDLTTQPSLPTNHFGYEFVKATSGLPKTILSDVSNNPPVFDPATAEREVPENSAAGTNVGAVIPEATDADTGDTLEYSLEGDDARFFDFDDSTRQITTKANVTYNYEAAKNSYEVAVKADDGRDSVTLAVTIRLTDVWERSAKPAPPTLSPISGSSTSLMASWVKPGRNGGPDITGYNVQYREGDGAWTDFAHDGTGVSTTITGLTAGASYQARVQAENGEGGSAWSDPSDAAVPNEAAGVLPRITAVRVTSVPELERDTYGRGETIRFTVYFSAPVAVTGSPHFTFSLGNRNAAREVDAPYESGSGTAALVFGYVVQEGDEDNNGIFLVDGDALGRAGPVALDTDETITALGGGLAADLSSSERGNQRDHKVDGSRALEGDAPTVVGRLKVTSWPARGGAAYGVGDTIVFTLTFSEKVRVKGQPQPALVFELGGEEHEARYHGLSDTDYVAGSPAPAPRSEAVKLHFEYRVGAGDRDDDGVSVGADAVRPGGATIRSAVTGFDADLFHGAVAPDPDHRVAAGTATEPAGPGVTIIDAKGNPLAGHRLVIPEGGQGRYGLKLNTRPAHPVHLKAIMSDGDEDLSVLPSFTQPSIAPGAWGAPRWVDIAAADDADSVDGERVFLHRVHSKDPAYNDLLLPDVVVVEADDDPKESGPPPPEITAVAVASEPALESDTYGYGETIRFRVEFSERVTVGGQPHFTFSLGNRNAGRRVDAPYESGNRTTALVFGYEVQRGDEDDNGIFLLVGRDFTDRAGPVGLGRGGLILAVEGGVAADLAHDRGRGAQRGHQVDGSRPVDPVSPVPTPPTNPTVDSLAVNSWPQSGGEVYRSGDTIVFTVTFSEKVRVEEGQPALAFDLGGARHWGVYHGLSDDDYEEGGPAPTPRSEAAKLHFAYQVDRFDRDADGVEVGELSGAMDLRRGTIRSAETGLDADLGHAAVGPLSDPVDGLAAEPATTAEPLTAEFEGLPSEHDGRTAFRFRIEFSEEVAVSAAAMRDDALTVSGGTVTGAARVDGRADRWSIEVTPSGAGEIGISLPPERDCAEAGAVCTADGRSLTTGLAVLVAGPPVEPLTASFEGMPAEHGGEGGLHFRVAFSEDIGISYRSLREDAFAVSGGRVTGGRRVDDRRDLFRMTVRPDSDGDVTITLPAGRDCGVSGAICTKGDDRRQLTNSPSATVTGPVGISAADARVEEGDGAVLAFAVTLSRAAGGTVAVDYATANGSAHAGVDYRAASGTLEFRAGESSKTVEVTVFDDSHDEGEETLTLRLSNASSGRVTDSEATGTIKNTDPLPRALLARFGRTAAVQVVEQVEARLEASRDPGFRGRVAGRELRRGMERDIALGLIRRLGGAAGVGRGVGGGGASGAMAGASGAAGFLPPGTAGGRRRSAPALPMRAAGSMGAVATGGASGSTGAGSTGGAAGSMGMAPSTSAAPSMGMAPSMRGASGSMGMGAGPMGGPMGMAGPMGGASGSMGMATRRMGGASGGDGWLNGRGFLEMGLGGGDVLTGSAFTLNRESGRGGVVSLEPRRAVALLGPRGRPVAGRRRAHDDVRGRLCQGAARRGPVAVEHPGPRRVLRPRLGPDALVGDRPLPVARLPGDGPHHRLGSDRLRRGRDAADPGRRPRPGERPVDGDGRRGHPGRAGRRGRRERLRARVQGRRAVGRHRHRRRRRPRGAARRDVGGGDPGAHRPGGLARLHPRRRAVAAAERRGGAAPRRRRRRDRRRRGRGRRPRRRPRVERPGGGRAGADAAGARGRRLLRAGRVAVAQLEPDAVDPAGADGAARPVVGRAGHERGRRAVGPRHDGGPGGARRPRLGQPPRRRARLRPAGRPPLRRDAAVRRRRHGVRPRLPVGLRPRRAEPRRADVRAGSRRPAPGEPPRQRHEPRGRRPGHRELVGLGLRDRRRRAVRGVAGFGGYEGTNRRVGEHMTGRRIRSANGTLRPAGGGRSGCVGPVERRNREATCAAFSTWRTGTMSMTRLWRGHCRPVLPEARLKSDQSPLRGTLSPFLGWRQR